MSGQKSEGRSIWDKIDISNKDERIVYALCLIMVAVPLLHPLGLPLEITYETRLAYNFFNNLPDGSTVAFKTMPATPEAITTMGPIVRAAWIHWMSKHFKILVLNFTPDPGAQIFIDFINSFQDKISPLPAYGVDYVIMPYVAASGAIRASLAADTWGTFPVDYYGTPVKDIPIMQYFRTAYNWNVFIGGGIDDPELFRIWQEPYGVPSVAFVTSMAWAILRPFLDSGQIKGMTNGLRGGVEYELLIGQPSSAAGQLDAQSMTHLMWFSLIVWGNVVYFASRRIRSKVTKEAK